MIHVNTSKHADLKRRRRLTSLPNSKARALLARSSPGLQYMGVALGHA